MLRYAHVHNESGRGESCAHVPVDVLRSLVPVDIKGRSPHEQSTLLSGVFVHECEVCVCMNVHAYMYVL